jgi:CelD/BcsL family acetyltransferase involved in cellulose biosynthesis
VRVQRLQDAALAPELFRAWSEIQRATPALASPYFRPEFTEAVAAVRGDVEVAVLEEGGTPVGFLPFQRARWNVGFPAGVKVSDFHGVIAGPGVEWNAEELIRGCGLATWQFDHLLAEQKPFVAHHYRPEGSPYLDLSRGFEAWRSERRRAGSRLVDQVLRKMRKLEREVGTPRFEWHTDSPAVFERLLAWKREQLADTEVVNVLRQPWVLALLERIRTLQSDDFSGLLSTLYVGDELVGVHFGMRSRHVMHWWFPTYNRDFQRYSPGLILLVELARAACERGIQRLDLGKGPESYKHSLSSGSIALAEGAVDCRALIRLGRLTWRRTRERVHASRLRGAARIPGRAFYHLRQWFALH